MSTEPRTVFDAIIESLEKAADYNKNDQSKPAAILWTDKDCQWLSLADKLRVALPEFLTMGNYEPEIKKGPGIWIRCMIARKLDEANWPQEAIPILYMPGVSRQELRAVEDCPEHLKPVVELQYRGVFWTQKNAKDWTILSFLQSKDGGLELDVVHDNNAKEAMKQALVKLADIQVSELKGKRLEAEDFYALIQPDPIRELLTWMNDPKAVQQGWSQASLKAFKNACKDTYGFNPEKDGELVAAEELGLRENSWNNVWERFAEAPQNYPNLPDLLKKARPAELFAEKSSWPQDNSQEEDKLRNELLGFAQLNPGEASKKIILLESTHGKRRDWVWAKLGRAPLAFALKHLSELALVTSKPLPSNSLKVMIEAYKDSGYKADAAVLNSLACCNEAEPRDIGAVSCAISAVYKPYLVESAERFQQLLDKKDLASLSEQKQIEAGDGECILFADGLRYDLGQQVCQELKQNQLDVKVSSRIAAIPTVTATAKPAVSPIAELLTGASDADDFMPTVRESSKKLTTDSFRKMLKEKGYQVLKGQKTGDVSKKAWMEHGEIDSYGHKHGKALAHHVKTELKSLVNRILGLLKAGYHKVIVVTDHGWLLVPTGLPKVDLPHYLATSRWGRCATLKENIAVDYPTQPWHYDKSIQMAFPHGIGVFYAGPEYSHGGLSLQECVTPILTITSSKSEIDVKINNYKWVGLRCRIELSGSYQDCQVDIRTRPADASSSLATPRKITEDGSVSLLIEDDEKIGESAIIVVLNEQGQVSAKLPVEIGS